MSGIFVNVGSLQRYGGRNGSLSRNLRALTPLARATWLLFDRQGNLSPLVQSGATSMGWLFDQTGTLKARPHNLLLWSEQFDNAVWAKTRSTVSINVTTAPNGTSTAEKLVEDTTNGTHVVAQSYSTFVSGERYTFSVSVKKSERPSVRITLPSTAFTADIYGHFNLETGTLVGASPGVTTTISSEGDGWYRCSVSGIATSTAVGTATIFTGNEANSINVSYTGDGTSGIFIWGAQLNQGELQPYYRTGTYNLLQFTEAFENAAWVKFVADISTNVTTAPNGTQTADKLIEQAASNQHCTSQVTTVSVGAQYTFSVYVKAAERTLCRVRCIFGSVSADAIFNLQTGTVVSGAGVIGSVGNGWYRCSVSGVSDSTTATSYVNVLTATDNLSYLGGVLTATDSLSYLGDGTSGIFIWGAQLVQGSDPLPYEPILGTTPAPAAFFGPRVSYDPANLSLGPFLLAEEARTNGIRNNTMQGAVAGTPGTLPTNWEGSVAVDGLSRSIIGMPVVNGIQCVDIRFSGISGTSASVVLIAVEGGNTVAATKGQIWTSSSYLALVGGSLNNVTVLQMRQRFNNSSGGALQVVNTTISGIAGQLQRYVASGTTSNTSTAFVNFTFTADFANNLPVDFTLRIGLPQLELGATASSPILTSGTAVTRSADNLSVTNLTATGFNAAGSTVYVDGTVPPNLSTFPPVVTLSDGSTNNQVHVYAHTSGVYSNVRSGGVIQGDVGRAVSPVTGSNFEFAVALRQNDAIAALNSQLGTLDSVLLMPVGMNQLRIGADASGGGQSVNAFRQLAIIPQRVSDSALQRLTRI